MLLRDLQLHDVPALAGLAPEDWHMALDAVMLSHLGRSYFLARVASDENGIAAVGQGIATGAAGWLGNIIVEPAARNRGLGRSVTLDLIDQLRARGCTNLLLVATALGEPVYRKIGFRRTGEYLFLRMPRLPIRASPAIRRLGPDDGEAVLALDATATGERRAALLGPHLGLGWVHGDAGGALDGFFLPSFGGGPVIARAPAAGVALLEFKHALFPQDAVVPSANAEALRFLLEHGGQVVSRAPRMALDAGDVAWEPACLFARGTGYSG